MTNKRRHYINVAGKHFSLVVDFISTTGLEGMRKTVKILSEDNRFLEGDLKRRPQNYKANCCSHYWNTLNVGAEQTI
jgi:hypothetical protein